MTKVQIWLVSVLALFLILFMLGRALKKEDTSTNKVENAVPQGNMSSQDVSGKDLIARLGCGTCHGRDLEGSQMAPALQNIAKNWSKDKLVNYLRNPSSFSDERFEQYREKYKNIIMPSYNQVDVQDLSKIAEYLMTR